VIPGGGATLSQFAIGADGSLSLTGSQENGLLEGARSLVVTPDGRQLYAASDTNGAISHFAIGSGGAPRLVGCVGDRAGCQHAAPVGLLAQSGALALDSAGRDLYVGGSDAVGSFSIAPVGARPRTGCPSVAQLAGPGQLSAAIPAARRATYGSRGVIAALSRGLASPYAATAAGRCGAALVRLSVYVAVRQDGRRCPGCERHLFLVQYRAGSWRAWLTL
jgi:hypothetical protein